MIESFLRRMIKVGDLTVRLADGRTLTAGDGTGPPVTLRVAAKALRRTGLDEGDREVTLIGVRDHLELWKRADWDAREAELSRRHSEIVALRARQARRGDSQAPPDYK